MAKAYSDVDVVERTIITPEGQVRKIYHLTARTTSGVLFSVDVSEEELGTPRAAEALAAKASQIESLKKA